MMPDIVITVGELRALGLRLPEHWADAAILKSAEFSDAGLVRNSVMIDCSASYTPPSVDTPA